MVCCILCAVRTSVHYVLQDPSSIQHLQAASGDMYAVPQAKKGKGEESMSEERKAHMTERNAQKAKTGGVSVIVQ